MLRTKYALGAVSRTWHIMSGPTIFVDMWLTRQRSELETDPWSSTAPGSLLCPVLVMPKVCDE